MGVANTGVQEVPAKPPFVLSAANYHAWVENLAPQMLKLTCLGAPTHTSPPPAHALTQALRHALRHTDTQTQTGTLARSRSHARAREHAHRATKGATVKICPALNESSSDTRASYEQLPT